MDIQGILLVVFFALSTTTVPIYVYFTQKHFVRTRLVNTFQLLFWLFLALSSVISVMNSVNVVSEIMNFLLIFAGVLFSSFFITKIYKDQGQYFMPFARLNNFDAFKEYGESLGEGYIKIYANTRNTVEAVLFINGPRKNEIIEEISANDALIMRKGTKEARTKLFTNFLFIIVIAAIALV